MPWDFGALNTLGSLRSFQTSLGGAGLATKLHSIRLSPSFLCFYLRYRNTQNYQNYASYFVQEHAALVAPKTAPALALWMQKAGSTRKF